MYVRCFQRKKKKKKKCKNSLLTQAKKKKRLLPYGIIIIIKKKNKVNRVSKAILSVFFGKTKLKNENLLPRPPPPKLSAP